MKITLNKEVRSFFVSLGLAAFLVSSSWNMSYADGKGIFAAKGCGDCHQSQAPAKEKINTRGPELWYAGSKFKKEWIKAWLEKPTIIRILKYNSIAEKNTGGHPAISKNEAVQVAGYLATLIAKEVVAGMITPNGGEAGRNLFQKKYGCIACHTLKNGTDLKGGASGPSLAEAGSRLNGDWVYAYLKDIKLFKPVGSRMPNFAGIISDNEMKILAAFVAAQK